MSVVVEQYAQLPVVDDLQELHPVLQRVYRARGIKNHFDLKTDLAELLPFNTLLGIETAVKLLAEALTQQQRIMIIGDFDADGATSTAVAVLVLTAFGFKHVDYLVPNRFEFGYGLTPEIVEVAAQSKPDLIITVDNGISSTAGVAAAKAKNIKVLITDHHLAADELPDADAIVNPNQPGDEFRSKHLAGVGVIFYILLAFRSYLREQDWFATQAITEPNMADYLDLVALGTVADVAVLDKNNRILVEQGLKRIRAGHCRPGIKALFAVANRELKTVTASDLGFVVGPRLNAAGRLEDMSLGIECLMTTNEQQAREMTEQLQNLNHERRAIEDEMRDQAFKILDKLKFDTTALPAGVCLFDPTWHQGVIGILASRIKDKYHRPTIAFAAVSDTEIKGSARSIEGLHIRDALDAIAKKHPELIAKFGGHAMAAGLSIARKEFEAFQKAFAEQVATTLPSAALQQKILTDGELSLTEMTLELAQLLKFALPWGQGFPEPLFEGTFDILDQRLVGQKHLKLVLKYNDKQFHAIAFNVDLKQWPNYRQHTLRAVYRLDVNNFNDYLSLQLLIEHIIN